MGRKYLAFDIETAAILPDGVTDLMAHRPLGVICVAVQATGERPGTWDARAGGRDRMMPDQLCEVIGYIRQRVADGYTLLTWNGCGFDLDILAEEACNHEHCCALCWDHVDPMFHVFCEKGFPVGLDRAAMGQEVQGKPPGMTGGMAPKLWAAGRYDEVLNYVCHDVRIVLEVTEASESSRQFYWVTQRGKLSSMPLARGWHDVRSAAQLPEPDTSWMDNPMPRSRFTAWMNRAVA